MAEHSMKQTVSAALLDADPTLRKYIIQKLTDGLMKAVKLEACFGETIVSMGPIKEGQGEDPCLVHFEESVTLTPLVRCRKCKNWDTEWEPSHAEEGQYFCPILGCVTDADFYCASGK